MNGLDKNRGISKSQMPSLTQTEHFNLRQNFLDALASGGLGQIYSRRGGSKTQFALSCLGAELRPLKVQAIEVRSSSETIDPPSDRNDSMCLAPGFSNLAPPSPFFIWIGEEGFPYPPLMHYWGIPLSRFLVLQVTTGNEAWKVALEAIQSGLFSWVFLRTQTFCNGTHLRKLQINAEKLRCKVILLCQTQLPHWPLRISVQIEKIYSEECHARAKNSLFSEPGKTPAFVRRGVPIAHAQGLPA